MNSKRKNNNTGENPRKKNKNSAIDEEIMNMHLIRFVVGCGLAFSVIEHKLFRKFITALNPEYASIIPCRKTLSTRLLSNLHTEICNEIKSKTPNEVVLLADSWKNSSGKSQNFAVMMHTSDGIPYMMNTYNMSSTPETSENLSFSVIC